MADGTLTARWQRWTKGEYDFLARHYQSASREWLSKKLGRSPDAIRVRANKCGLRRATGLRKRLSPEKEARLMRRLKLRQRLTDQALSQDTGLSVKTIQRYAAIARGKAWGIRKSEKC